MIDWICDNEGIAGCLMALQKGFKRSCKKFLCNLVFVSKNEGFVRQGEDEISAI